MVRPLKTITSVDAYIATAPQEARAMVEQLRATIRAVAPKADESIKYGMPFYTYKGRPLVGFAAFKNHCGFYGSNATFLKTYKDELTPYRTAPGTVRFPIGKPLPVSLIRKLLRARMRDHDAR